MPQEWTPARDVTKARSGGFGGPEVSDIRSAASNENHPTSRQAIAEGQADGRRKKYVIEAQGLSDVAKKNTLAETVKQYVELSRLTFRAAECGVVKGSTRGALVDIRAGWYQFGVAKGLGGKPVSPRFRLPK